MYYSVRSQNNKLLALEEHSQVNVFAGERHWRAIIWENAPDLRGPHVGDLIYDTFIFKS